jgi:hypothetical protein
MTRDDITRMWEKANGWSPAELDETVKELERFAELVAAAEREACAALCFQMWNKWMDEKDTTPFPDAEDCAAQIRARG